jgi:hypothetical protein
MAREIGLATVALPALGETPTPIILGQPGDVALLGAETLEELGFTPQPVHTHAPSGRAVDGLR